MKRINRNIYPSMGYTFKERDGTSHRGTSWEDLEKKVTNYRQRVGWPTDRVGSDIGDQVCASYPTFCHTSGPFVVPERGKVAMTLTQRVLHWYIHLLDLKRRNALPRVDDQTASARARICQRCPKQVPMSGACGSCVRSVEMSKLAALNGQKSLHQNLLLCSALGEDPAVTVHVEQAPVNPVGLPHECWRRPQ